MMPLAGCHEPVSSLSHLLGAFYFAWLATQLIRRGRGDWARTSSLTIMASCSVLLLFLSSSYHYFFPGPMREFMVRADISAIFLVIAGSMTPVHAILFSGRARWLPLLLIWTAAFVGIILRMIFYEAMSGRVGVTVFLLFGWAGTITFFVLWRRFGWTFVKPALLSGLCYTMGAVSLLLHRPILIEGVIGPHELWHISVLFGLGLHWYFVFQFAAGYEPASVRYEPAPTEYEESQGLANC